LLWIIASSFLSRLYLVACFACPTHQFIIGVSLSSNSQQYSQRWTDFEQSEESGSSAPQQPYSTEVLPAFANHVRARSEFRDPKGHQELQADLVKHIWTKFGMGRG
jgi:hypothetical protein